MKSRLLLTTALAVFAFGDTAFGASQHTLVFTSSGTFTIPATAVAGTEFEFTVIGGGGGGGGCFSSSYNAPGGGSGGAGMASFSGFTAGQTVTITIGAGGTAGNNTGTSGGAGGNSRLTFSGVNIVSTTGGAGSSGQGTGSLTGGTAGTFTAAVGASGLTLASSLNYAAQDGLSYELPGSFTGLITVAGGGNPLGMAGTITHKNGSLGGGALGCQAATGAGGTGGGGVVTVRWSL